MEASSNLRCLLIAVQGGQVILPNSLVVEVLPFATPLQIEAAPQQGPLGDSIDQRRLEGSLDAPSLTS